MPITFVLNGTSRQIEPRPDETLLESLRERCGITSLKDGCSPQGQCGCCLALIDGNPKVTCATPAAAADGKEILTLEGLPAAERTLIGNAFAAATGLQCGFCIPGIALRAHHLTARNPRPSRAEIAKAIDMHLCRCTGYVKIVDAIELIAQARRGEPVPEPCRDGRVGASLARHRAAENTLGDHHYVNDLDVPGMLHGALVLSPHARARVVRIDTERARAHPGVIAVATAADVPGERWNGLLYPDWPGFVAEGEEVRCVGDVLAAIAAVDRHTAREAARLVEVEYQPLPAVLDPDAALEPGAPRVNPTHDNLLSRSVIQRGDAEAALAASAHVVSGTWATQRIEHLFMEPESALAQPLPDGRLRLCSQGQGVFDDRRQVARFLGIPEDRIFVEMVPNGGAFGGKEDMSVQAQTALLARLTGRPVKLTLSREESIRLHPKRHPITMHYTVGCDAEGRLTAVRARMLGDSGAYASVGGKVLERAAGHACGPYKIPNVDIEARAVYTNNPPCGAMRGFGANQTNFALEGMMDRLAEQVGIDGWDIRYRNAVETGDIFGTGQKLGPGVGIKKTLLAVRDAYKSARYAGIGSAVKNSGVGNGLTEYGRAILRPEADGSLTIYHSWTEMGQGVNTVLMQMACEELGITPDKVTVLVDSERDLGTGQTTASRATVLGGQAVIDAARKLRAELTGSRLEDLAGREFYGEMKVDWTTQVGAKVDNPVTHMAYGWATQVVILDAEGHLEKVIAAHDVGKVINPTLLEGQVEGAVHMGLGHSLSEEFVVSNGVPVTTTLKSLNIIPPTGMPPVECIFVEEHQPEGPYGAKGIGEIGLVPTAGAVAGALYAFEGTRRTRLPMKDSVAAMAAVPKLGARGRSG